MSASEHRQAAAELIVRVAVVTVSDTRGPGNDPGGDLLGAKLTAAGTVVARREHARDDQPAIVRLLRELIADDDIDAVITTGGTGVSPRDVTPEAMAEVIEKPMPGFGELFRQLSHAEVGTAAMLSRATAGTAGRTFLAALPGSPKAVELACVQLLAPELGHLVQQLRKPERR